MRFNQISPLEHFVPQVGLEPTMFATWVLDPKSSAFQPNFATEAGITEESSERGFYWWNRTTEVLIRSQLFIH
jgi:hypothetical protein